MEVELKNIINQESQLSDSVEDDIIGKTGIMLPQQNQIGHQPIKMIAQPQSKTASIT